MGLLKRSQASDLVAEHDPVEVPQLAGMLGVVAPGEALLDTTATIHTTSTTWPFQSNSVTQMGRRNSSQSTSTWCRILGPQSYGQA